jgi:hypothetical protein
VSLNVILWALKEAPVEDPTQALILCAMADTAKADGTEARAAQATYATAARCSERTLRRHLQAMEKAGVIVRGDQELVAHLRPDRRPVVWNLSIGMRRSTAGQNDRPDSSVRGDNMTDRTRVSPRSPERGVKYDTNGRTLVTDKPTTEPSLKDEPSKSVAGDEGLLIHADVIDAEPVVADAPATSREDVEQVCQYLADRIEENGSRRPTITKGWRDAARLMIDRDGIHPDSLMGAIKWSQDHDFWRSNILSMPKLRKQYDRMRLQAEAQAQPQQSTTDRKVQQTMDLAARLRAQGR